ncbi:N-acetylglucosamine kinase [Brevibacillus sp. B_LB10_24]|uniref:N-acetylglucosamine kinase n=1 Tax=Brevibacillus sp. B_LB10_24 TaxID=3380645 RepID=UPI0038B88E88
MNDRKIPLLAVDGGGTKCLAVFVDEQDVIVGQGRAGSCNYQGIGKEAAARELVQAIRAAMEDAALNRDDADWPAGLGIVVECAVFGLAGLDTEHDRKKVRGIVEEVLQRLHIQVNHLIVENDGFAALLGAVEAGPGILAIAGTGSIVYGIDEHGRSVRAGGWGHRIGDEGSGYWIGKQAIAAVLKAHDGRGVRTRLGEWILSHLGLPDVEALFIWIYSSEYSVEKVAELSRFVTMAALAGDREARSILTCAGDELFLAVSAVAGRLDLQNRRFKLVLQGGVLQNDGYVRQRLIDRIRKYAPFVQVDKAKREPIYGIIAKGHAYLKGEGAAGS